MLYRSIYIGNPAYLKLKDKQLKVTDPETKEEKGSVPIEDIGLLMLDHYQITLSPADTGTNEKQCNPYQL